MSRKVHKQQTNNRVVIRSVITVASISAAIVIVSLMWLWSIMDSRTYQVTGKLVNRVETREKIVALTFDDGPYPGNTEKLMKILKNEDVKATFFLIGLEIQRHPNQAKMIHDEGHVIGNHSYQHAHMVFLQPRVIHDELSKTDALIQSIGAPKPSLFRPPYGSKMIITPYLVDKAGMTTVMWDVAPDDIPENWNRPGRLVDYTRQNVMPGSIIILHTMYPWNQGNLAAVEPLIRTLKSDGYRFVTIPELLNYQ